VTSHDGDSTQTSRMRLLNAGKTLFARHGYEQTSTAAIARESGSSESQLIRYFAGKAGLLEAIFNDAWAGLNELVQPHIAGAKHGRDAIVQLLSLMIRVLERDHDIAFLFLFESRRIRGSSQEVLLSRGFAEFNRMVGEMIERGRNDGSFRTDVRPEALGSAMLGVAEGLLRDRVLAERMKRPMPFDEDDIVRTFTAMVDGLAPASSSNPA